MPAPDLLDIFLVTAPGHEPALVDEARARGFPGPKAVPGGVVMKGRWPVVWRANLELRGAVRVLVRIAAFRAAHLRDLEAGARRIDWTGILRPDAPVRVEATCRRSRIYHSGAAAERVADAIKASLGLEIDDAAEVAIRLRIDANMCTVSVDTSGEPLYKRGHKTAVGKAPMRETMAALFLLQSGYDGSEPVLDPLCGSGTFLIEAAEIAAGLAAGRARHFAFERLAAFDPAAWESVRKAAETRRKPPPPFRFRGFDRDPGAVRMSRENAERAGVGDLIEFAVGDVSDLAAPPGPPGLVIANPPYGARLGDRHGLARLYRTLGERLSSGFSGWRAGIVTADPGLAAATGLTYAATSPAVSHGGLRTRLYLTAPLR
jgi:putative N6-adenine-specific DNA methylase